MGTVSRTVVLLLLFSCNIDESFRYQVDPRLEKHLNMFFSEASARGRNYEVRDITISVTPNLREEEDRWAVSRGPNAQRIVIEVDEAFLLTSSDMVIEFAVMHELGHAFLGRPHSSSYSIMNPTRRILNDYSGVPEKRIELLDELFW